MLDDNKITALQVSSGHSVFSPSSMKRIMLCPGSVGMSLQYPDPGSSSYAEKGTLLHGYCEQALTIGFENPYRYISERNWEEEDKELVLAAIDYVLDLITKHEETPLVLFEAKGTLDLWGLPQVYGTMDVQIISPKRIDVADYKFGHGIMVFADGNPQCACYLAGSIPYDGSSVPKQELHVHIVQPTLDHYDDWHVEWNDLCQIILGSIQDAVAESMTASPGFEPSMEACRWCNAKIGCEHRKAAVREATIAVVKASKSPADHDKAYWKAILDGADAIGQAIKDVRLYAQAEINSGRGFPGYKLIAGRSTRKFKDQEAGEKYIKERLGDKAIVPGKVISLAQAEKKDSSLKKSSTWKDLITKPTGKPVLVHESDKRAALEFSLQNEFENDAENDGDVGQIAAPKTPADPFG